MATWQHFATTLITTASEGPSPFVLTAVLLDYMTEPERESLTMILLRKLSPAALDRANTYGSLLTPDEPNEEVEEDEPADDEGDEDAAEASAENNATAHLDVLKGGKSLTATEIAEKTGLKVETVRKRLAKSVERGQVRKLETAQPGPAHWTLTAE